MSDIKYNVSSTEKLRKSADDMETKGLLFLMNFHTDREEIYYFVIDFFNDVTGMGNSHKNTKLWDVQSKGAKSPSPKEIGKSLVTLYKNYLSCFSFESYILLLGGDTSSFRIDQSKQVFGLENIRSEALPLVIAGLKEECTEKTYIDNSSISDNSISTFLSNIIFVIDDKKPSEYVKKIIEKYPEIECDEKILNDIFKEIKQKQSSLKGLSMVENLEISTPKEALTYQRHLKNTDINLMVIHRILNRNPVTYDGVPIPFLPIYNEWPTDDKKDNLDKCKQSIIRVLFNKNLSQNFWDLFSVLYTLITDNTENDLSTIYSKIDTNLVTKCPDFYKDSLLYFISIMKDGLER